MVETTSPPPSTSTHDLPRGAMPPERVTFKDTTTPLASPNERLLSDTDAQYASYHEKSHTSPDIRENDVLSKPWIPFPLRVWFWLPFVLVMVLGAIGLEIALHFSKKNNGWASNVDANDKAGIMHYVYTLPPVAVAAIVAALWTWTDIEIKKMQPYVDLVHGDSPPQRSLLLDYTRINNFIVWGRAAKHKHYLVALASLMVLLTLTFQPLAAALLVVNDVWWSVPNQTMQTVQQIGLNQDLQFDDLTSFLTAAGFSSASVLYSLPNPPFTLDGYTVAEFQLPTNVIKNGTVVSANTTAMRSDPGCISAPVDMVQNADGSGWTNTVNGSNGCSIVFDVDKSSTTLFGTDTVICDNDQPDQFRPIVFWFFTYQPTAAASATLCFPTFTLWDVNVKVDLGSGNITKVTQLQPFSSSSNFSSLSANVTGPPLNGRAYNGIQFNLTDPDAFVLARRNATQLQMPAAVYQSAVQSPEGLVGSFEADRFVRLSTNVYRTYLTLIAKKVYFLDAQDPLDVSIMTIQPRVFLSDVAVHLLAVAMLILAFFATIVQLLHRQDRRSLRLQHEPGTIASAVAIGAQTGMGDLLAGRQRESDMNEALKNRRFRIDPRTMKIFMEGEEGYEWAKTPTEAEKYDRRKSIFAAMQGQKADFAAWRHPKSPKSPK